MTSRLVPTLFRFVASFTGSSRSRGAICASTLIACHVALNGAEGGVTPAPSIDTATPSNTIVVEGRRDSMVGIADSAAEGTIGADQLAIRPFLRAGEVMETVPGLIVTQHSGTGKANQYFLRGFNLDHGTDFATSIDGMPVNLPTHAHGQGYLDLNGLIPEIVNTITYRKGVYYADVGDFSSAGSSAIHIADTLPHGIASVTGGLDSYGRVLLADSPALGSGHLLYALEAQHSNGPWEVAEQFNKYNGVLRFSSGDAINGYSLTAMAYHATWNSTDQIPERAVDGGFIGRLGAMDSGDGGETTRLSIQGEWRFGDQHHQTTLNAYAFRYQLNLFSNFTYYLDDPVNGDQFEQIDRRTVTGGTIKHAWDARLGQMPTFNEVGIQVRNDAIPLVGIKHTVAREEIGTVREDSVTETTAGVYAKSTINWTDWLRTTPGLRADIYRFHVDSDNTANNGTETAGIASPKFTTVFGPWKDTEYYLNLGMGFHSNDARGTTITVDPGSGAPVDKVTPVVRSKGGEVGLRTTALPGLQSTLAFWVLKLDSELVFSGDAGTTEPSRPSERHGIEWANYWTPFTGWMIDADYSWTQARFTEDDPVGDHIPGALEQVVAAGISYDHGDGPLGSLRLRYFGPRPLIEDNSVRSSKTLLLNANVGYRYRSLTGMVELLNLLNSKDHDIDYYYTSRLQGEPAGGVDDVHYHPVEPFTVRGTVRYDF